MTYELSAAPPPFIDNNANYSYLTLRKLWLFFQHTWPHPLLINSAALQRIDTPHFPTIEVRRNKMVWWMQIKKCVTLRSARSYSPSFGSLLSSGFFPSNRSATTHASRRERGEDREGVGVERERRREREKGNSWSDEKESDSYRKAINEYGRLRVSIPTEIFFFSRPQQVARPPVEIMQMGEKEIQQWVDVKCWGPVS